MRAWDLDRSSCSCSCGVENPTSHVPAQSSSSLSNRAATSSSIGEPLLAVPTPSLPAAFAVPEAGLAVDAVAWGGENIMVEADVACDTPWVGDTTALKGRRTTVTEMGASSLAPGSGTCNAITNA